MEVSGQFGAPTAIPLGKTTGIFRMGGWPGLKTSQDSSDKRKPFKSVGNLSMIIQLSNRILVTILIHTNQIKNLVSTFINEI
jgi:hypothetical protein